MYSVLTASDLNQQANAAVVHSNFLRRQTMRRSIAFIPLMVVISLAAPSYLRAQTTSQSVSIPHLSAKVRLADLPQDNRPILIVHFATDNRSLENVNCLNAYRDFHFILKDAGGKSVPEDPSAWQNEGDSMTQQDSDGPCDKRPWSERESRAFVQVVFPTAPTGIYTLYMWLAPRGKTQQAQLAPISVIIP
jgi:hypothetical protein